MNRAGSSKPFSTQYTRCLSRSASSSWERSTATSAEKWSRKHVRRSSCMAPSPLGLFDGAAGAFLSPAGPAAEAARTLRTHKHRPSARHGRRPDQDRAGSMIFVPRGNPSIRSPGGGLLGANGPCRRPEGRPTKACHAAVVGRALAYSALGQHVGLKPVLSLSKGPTYKGRATSLLGIAEVGRALARQVRPANMRVGVDANIRRPEGLQTELGPTAPATPTPPRRGRRPPARTGCRTHQTSAALRRQSRTPARAHRQGRGPAPRANRGRSR